MVQAAVGAVVAIIVAFAYQVSRYGRQLRAPATTRWRPARSASPSTVSAWSPRAGAWPASPAASTCTTCRSTSTPFYRPDLHNLAMLVIGGMTASGARGRRRARGLRPRLAARRGENGAMGVDLAVRPDRRGRGTDGARPDPPADRDHRGQGGHAFARLARARLERRAHEDLRGRSGAVGSLFAANLATLDDVEVWAFDLNEAHVEAIKKNGLQLTGADDSRAPERTSDPGDPAADSSGSSRRRRCMPLRSPPPPMSSRRRRRLRDERASGTRRRSRRTSSA